MVKRRLFVSLVVFLFLFPFNIAAENYTKPDVSSEAAILIDAKSGQTLYGKNENKRMNPASITKIATAIYAIENSDMDDQVVVSEQATRVDGTRVYLEPGEVVPLKKLLIGMIVNSGNDAAVAIAEHIDGSPENFEKNFNTYLREQIGVHNTHFKNPNGLFANNHYTTASDMAKITKYAMANEEFRSIFNIQEYQWKGQSWDTTLVNHHRLLLGEFPFDAEITGGKNGYTGESGFTLVTTAKKGDLDLIVVTMQTNFKNAPYEDTMGLLDFGFQNFQMKQIPKGTEYEVNGTEFVAEDDLLYSENINDTYSNEVDQMGKLSIYNSAKEQIASFQLKSLTIPTSMEEGVASSKEGMQLKTLFNSLGFFVFSIVMITVIIFFQRLRKRA